MDLVGKNIEKIELSKRQLIASRYKRVTKAINRDFWNSDSETEHSRYVGSYGRGTAITTSDIDILITLPDSEFDHYNILKGNSQSRLLSAVRYAILQTLPNSEVRADGQVVKINFSDGIKFEILPAFQKRDNTYNYTDSNMGGHWLSTNPLVEQAAMSEKDRSSRGLLRDTCKHIRYIRDNYFGSYHLSGIVIDSFVYAAIDDWHWIEEPSYGEQPSERGAYEHHLLRKFELFSCGNILCVNTPGSNMYLYTSDSYACLSKVLNFMVK